MAWIWAAVFMAGIGAWLGFALRIVRDAELPPQVRRRARWWRRWGWTVSGLCSLGAVVLIAC